MKLQDANPRLYAFFNSKVLNLLMIVESICLLFMTFLPEMNLPVVIGTIIFIFFIIYTLWFWIKKPERIVINKLFSNIFTILFLYYFVIIGFGKLNIWTCVLPVLLVLGSLVFSIFKRRDEIFEIKI